MATVSRITPELRELHVPEQLRKFPGFVIWRYEARFEGDPKPLKVPYWPLGGKRYGRQGDAKDRANLTTFEVARDAAVRRGFDGVGFALMAEWGIAALDFDNCNGENGAIAPEIERIISRTYAEVSPSGKGLRVLLQGDLGNHKSLSDFEPFGLETFSSSGFVTLTGNIHAITDLLGHENTIAEVDDFTREFCAKRFAASAAQRDPDDFMAGFEPKLGITESQATNYLDSLDPGMGREDWIVVGMALHHEFGDDGFALWDEWSSEGHNYPGTEALRTDWDSFERRMGPGRRQVTMASVIKMAREAGEVASKPVSAETLREEAASATQDTFDGKFRPTRASRLSDKPTQWHIKGILPSTLDPVVLFGSSGAGKSFVALELACSIVRGVAWRGHRVRKGRVLYIAAEGMGGIRKRLQAYCRKHEIDIDDLDIDVIGASPNILEVDDVKEVTKSIAAFGPYDLVIVDTLAQVTPGANENAGEDMGKALANIKAVQRATGATVMVIHHAGKDTSKGARGWSGIKAAAEAQIEVYRDEETGARHIHIEKMKDGEDGMRLGFTLETMVLSMDEDGDEVSSCVVTEAEFVAPVAKSKGGPARGVTVRGGVQGAIAEAVHTTDPSLATMRLAAFIDEVMKLMPEADEGKRDTRRQNVARAIRSWSGKADAPLSVQGELVVFHE